VTEKDVVSNPKKVKLQPIEAAQLPRTLDDVEFVVVPGNFATSAGLKFTSALTLEKPPVAYQQVVAVRTADKDTVWAKDLAAAFKSPFFKDVLNKDFPGYTNPQGL
jgi:D-methionine transport system substrate-binding protein